MSHLERLGYILGTLLVGAAAYIVITNRNSIGWRRRNSPPVTELALELQQAWSGYHNR